MSRKSKIEEAERKIAYWLKNAGKPGAFANRQRWQNTLLRLNGQPWEGETAYEAIKRELAQPILP